MSHDCENLRGLQEQECEGVKCQAQGGKREGKKAARNKDNDDSSDDSDGDSDGNGDSTYFLQATIRALFVWFKRLSGGPKSDENPPYSWSFFYFGRSFDFILDSI